MRSLNKKGFVIINLSIYFFHFSYYCWSLILFFDLFFLLISLNFSLHILLLFFFFSFNLDGCPLKLWLSFDFCMRTSSWKKENLQMKKAQHIEDYLIYFFFLKFCYHKVFSRVTPIWLLKNSRKYMYVPVYLASNLNTVFNWLHEIFLLISAVILQKSVLRSLEKSGLKKRIN